MAGKNLEETRSGEDSTLNNVVSRAGSAVGNISKTAISSATSRSDSATTRAIGSLALAGATTLFDKISGADSQGIPPQYASGGNIEVQQRDYFDTYQFASNTFANPTTLDKDYSVENNHPMVKSLFLVDFEFNKSISANNRFKNLYPKSMSFLLKNMTMPKADIETEILNAYNRHVIAPKKITYAPVTCTFGDIYHAYNDADSRVSLMDLFKQYMSYYFNDFVKDGDVPLHAGYSSDRIEKQFLSNIHIYFFWSDGARRITLHNPFIKGFAYDTLDYTSDEQLTMSCEIEYEYINMSKLDLTYDEFMTSASDLLDEVKEGTKNNNSTNPYANDAALNPGPAPEDFQRNTSLDNPAAQTLLRLAEIEAVQLAGDLLNSDNPIVRAAAEEGVDMGLDIAAAGVGATNDLLGGLL